MDAGRVWKVAASSSVQGSQQARLISLDAFQYVMILNTLEKRVLGGF